MVVFVRDNIERKLVSYVMNVEAEAPIQYGPERDSVCDNNLYHYGYHRFLETTHIIRPLCNSPFPSVNDRAAVDAVDGRQDSVAHSSGEATRMCRSTERASLEKYPSIRLSQEPCLGVNTKVKRPSGRVGEPSLGFLGFVGGVIVENDLDGGPRRVGGVEALEVRDELARAMSLLDAGVNDACH